VRRSRRLASWLLLLAIPLACRPAPLGPAETVAAYLRDLGRDPIRTLDLLTPGFHRSHGLVAGASASTPEGRVRIPREERAHRMAATASRNLESARLAWLAVQRGASFRRDASALSWEVMGVEQRGASARVVCRIHPQGAAAFQQSFELVRGSDGRWRIDAIRQSGVEPRAEAAAFAAYPNERARQSREAAAQRAAGERSP
jgi:hypothetical protein